MNKFLTRKLPEPAKEPETPQSVLKQALEMPQLLPVRLFWEQLREVRPWWPVLIPALLWVGWRTYRRERAELLNRKTTLG
jgi:hypothetical protein